MNIKKSILAFSLIFLLSYSYIFSFISFANSEKSETVKLSAFNIKDITNGKYTYEIDLPKDFGEFISYTFDKTSQHTATGIESVVYDSNRNKLLVTFTKGSGEIIDVNGYLNEGKRLFQTNPYNAVCRYSDGARWQLAEYRTNDFLNVYRIEDFTKEAKKRGMSIPYDFIFDVYTVNGKVSPNKDVNVPYWVDKNGVAYDNAQIDQSSRYIKKDAIKIPIGLETKSIVYANDWDSKKNYTFVFNYKMVSKENVVTTQGDEGVKFNDHIPRSVMTGHAMCKQYEYKVEYFVSAKTKPIHNIDATFTYYYKTTDEPKIIATIIAEPSQVQFEGKDVDVKVTLKAELINVKNVGIVDYFRLYLRTEDSTQNPQPLGYKKDGNTFKAEVSEQFKIPASKLGDANEFTEYFVGRAYAYFKDNTNIMSNFVKASTVVFKTPPVPIIEEEHEIVAKIDGNKVVKLGDDTTYNAFGSYSTNSTIEGYRWDLPHAMIQPSGQYEAGEVTFTTWYNKLGTERAIVYVIDAEGRQAGAFMDIEVVEPTIEAYISQSGTPKENRKVTFTARIDTPTRYPVSKLEWTVQSLNGDLDSYIRHEQDLSDKSTIDTLFKKAGEYIVTLYVENTAGYSYETTYVVEIKEDKQPAVDFDFQQKIYRDPSNNNLATFELTDYSYSYDGDYVAQRNWYVIFDANNDGQFTEQAVLFNTGNNTKVTYTTSHVGKYQFILEAIEEFGEETIEAYVTADDRRRLKTTEW